MSDISHAYKENFVPIKPLSRDTHPDETRTYFYNNEPVDVVVVFDEGKNKIAIVENVLGEQFDVPMNELRTA